MAQTLRQLRRQIRLVGKIHQITRAMQMVAAAKLRRVQQRATEGKVYWQRMQDVVQEIGAASSDVQHPLLTPRPVERIGLVVISADKGLCGGYNAQVGREARQFLDTCDVPVDIRLAGLKTKSAIQRAGGNVVGEFEKDDRTLAADASRMALGLRGWFESGEVDQVHLTYAQFISVGRDKPSTIQLLPVPPPEHDEDAPASEYIFEPEPEELFQRLLPRYVDAQVYQMLLEASASEHAARMRAMAAATENAEELTEKLTMQANRMRQQEITAQLLDVVGGSEALA
ncbi:MAG TPA: ATP synthase F1 subunit gamma [Armatimonadota bacterium]|nr:ATP synthase F1 subunit gamma [Armatimonadota bacterium]